MIILICGKQGSGKTTLSNGLEKKLNNSVAMKFAEPLYAMHEAIYDVLATYGIYKGPEIDGPLLQVLGTEWGRKKDSEFWVNIMKTRVINFIRENYKMSSIHPNIIIDDCRFENEFRAFDAISPVLKVLLHAEEDTRKARAAKWRENTMHPSETGLDHIVASEFDLVVQTDESSKEETLQKVLRKLSV